MPEFLFVIAKKREVAAPGAFLIFLSTLLAIVSGCVKSDAPTNAAPTLDASLSHSASNPTLFDSAAADTKPVFPDLPPPMKFVRGVDFYKVHIGGSGPGLPMELLLYLPSGRHERQSLPCVFVAPAGASMWGMALAAGDIFEHIPYARVGFAVVAYEVSGGYKPPKDAKVTYREIIGPVKKFMEADGGMVNAHIAIDFALQKVPEVDPNQLYTCGHSSAAIQALDLAANDHRIRACCAYAPCTDFAKHWGDSKLSQFIPGFADFAVRDAPMTHIGDFNCPVFLFHADDDKNLNCTLPDNQAFADAMRAAKKDITFQRVPSGGHYMSMIKQGIPAGIAFLRAHGAKPSPPIVEKNDALPKNAASSH